MKFSEQLISIFESEVFEQFNNANRLGMALTELAYENLQKNINYEYSEISKMHTDLINQTFLHPIILSAYSGFESLLQHLCKWIETDFDFRESVEPFHRYNLKDVGKFLRGNDEQTKWNINLFDQELERDWNTLTTYQQLRNLIVHFNGNYQLIPVDKRAQYQQILKIEHLSQGPNGTIILEGKLPKIYIDFLNSFINNLIRRIKQYES
jgi:hypothetical protein